MHRVIWDAKQEALKMIRRSIDFIKPVVLNMLEEQHG
jgi:hypothetical protein